MLPKLHIIIGSTRPGRIGPAIARWFESHARENGKFDVALVDLAEFRLPIYDEPKHPMMQQYEHAHTKAWSASVAAADAYVFVTPEYNFGIPPSLLNALTYVYKEWNYKPGGVVSYGGVSGGLRAAQALRQAIATLKIMPIPEGVAIPNFPQFIGADDGAFTPNDLVKTGATTMLDELARWSGALKSLKAA